MACNNHVNFSNLLKLNLTCVKTLCVVIQSPAGCDSSLRTRDQLENSNIVQNLREISGWKFFPLSRWRSVVSSLECIEPNNTKLVLPNNADLPWCWRVLFVRQRNRLWRTCCSDRRNRSSPYDGNAYAYYRGHRVNPDIYLVSYTHDTFAYPRRVCARTAIGLCTTYRVYTGRTDIESIYCSMRDMLIARWWPKLNTAWVGNAFVRNR